MEEEDENWPALQIASSQEFPLFGTHEERAEVQVPAYVSGSSLLELIKEAVYVGINPGPLVKQPKGVGASAARAAGAS